MVREQKGAVMPENSTDPTRPLLDLGDQIVGLAGRVASATCRWLLLVAEFDDRDGADAYGLSTTSAWLAHHCGLAERTARDHVRVARALAAFPALAASMGAGRISYSHARTIAGIATAGEDALVADLLVLAEYGTIAQLEAMIAGLRSVDRDYADPIDPRPTRGETVNFRDRPDARVGLSGRLDPEHAVVLRAALDAVRAADTAEAGPDEEPMSTAGALVRMAELVLGLLAERGEDLPVRREDQDTTIVVHLHAVPSTEPAAQDPVPHDRNGSREPRDWRLVPETALAAARLQDQNGSREPHSPDSDSLSLPSVPLARLTGRSGGPAGAAGLPGPVVERLACSARVKVVVHGSDGNVLDLGYTRRLASDKQFQALLARHGGRCAHPGCRRRHNLHAHHVIFWQDDGPTDMDNLLLLCDYHHASVHRGELTVRAWGNQRFTFTHHGRPLPAHVDPSRFITTLVPVEDEHDQVSPDAAGNRWDGTRMNLSYATSCLAVPRYHDRDHRRATAVA